MRAHYLQVRVIVPVGIDQQEPPAVDVGLHDVELPHSPALVLGETIRTTPPS